MLTAVIPTRKRPSDLAKAVASVLKQTVLPDELMIVDQSPDDESRSIVEALVCAKAGLMLTYIHDTRIAGLVDAKRVAANMASGDLVCFLEDDVILEPDYIKEIIQGFVDHPDMVGCSGIIINPPPLPLYYEVIFHLFHRGIFRDKRISIYGRFSGHGHPLIASNLISGGLSAWRREVFAVVPFDVESGFHMLEDIDFSTRVAQHYGQRLYINPNARLEHHWSPVNREILAGRQRRKLVEIIRFYKKRHDWPGASLSFQWLLLGLLLESTMQSLSTRSFGPLYSYLTGIRDGIQK